MKDVFVLFNIYGICYFINAPVGRGKKKKVPTNQMQNKKSIKVFQIKNDPFALKKELRS